jgi:hypothetical protein
MWRPNWWGTPEPSGDPLSESEGQRFMREVRTGSDLLLAFVFAVVFAVVAAAVGIWWLLAAVPIAGAVHVMRAWRRTVLAQRDEARRALRDERSRAATVEGDLAGGLDQAREETRRERAHLALHRAIWTAYREIAGGTFSPAPMGSTQTINLSAYSALRSLTGSAANAFRTLGIDPTPLEERAEPSGENVTREDLRYELEQRIHIVQQLYPDLMR